MILLTFNFMAYRMLVADRTESRVTEKIALVLTKPFQYLAPTLITTPIEILAKSMIRNTIYDSGEKVEILLNSQIFELAKLYDKK
jgi:hypothetical protein